jgi:putative ABC transport system permease protein
LLKKSDPGYSGKENLFGKWSVILQFIVAQAVIIATLIIVKQIYFINNKDLGYDTKNIMVVNLPGGAGSKLSALAGEYSTNPKVQGVSFSNITPAQTTNFGNARLFKNNEMVTIDCELKSIDTSFIRVYSFKMLAGENFASSDTALNIIVNRKFTSEIGFKTVEEALGSYIQGITRRPACIKGVVENFYSGSLHDKIRPCAFTYSPNRASIMNIKLADSGTGKSAVNPGDIDQIKAVWNRILPDQEFEYTFLSDRIALYYRSEHKAMNLFLLFAAMTIILCVLGILGLSLSMNERRIKEIGIRKVNGATVQEILVLLNKNFVRWVAIAFALATPVAWYAMNKWLENFAYKTTLSWWIFLLSGMLALAIALLTVTWQSWKAASQNPVVALRYE